MALSDSRGSPDEYQGLVKEFQTFDMASITGDPRW